MRRVGPQCSHNRRKLQSGGADMDMTMRVRTIVLVELDQQLLGSFVRLAEINLSTLSLGTFMAVISLVVVL